MTVIDIMELPLRGSAEPPFEMQIPDYPHSHEVRVWLPPSYHHSATSYPVLWVTDNLLEHAVTALSASQNGEVPEVIVVAVGAPGEVSLGTFTHRRNYDFLPGRELLTYDDTTLAHFGEVSVGGAPAFLEYLTGPLRTQIQETYRTNDDHALIGHSGGAMFALYALFTKPEAFSKYVIGSPARGIDYERLEAERHAAQGPIAARVFLAAGGAELTAVAYAAIGVVSTMASVSERLVTRGYPELLVSANVYPGYTHVGVMPLVFADGIRWIWKD